jgi:hypothetical protein
MVKVVRVRRRWAYQIIYTVTDRWLWIDMIVPTWHLPDTG